ncbi:HEPN domain-containing protein [Dickeya chrysanthemi]|uniref:HEPN domain-containing protein n=1 Tax=Dickeya chrysanthemi TaxID=556 RepID=UPI0025A0ADA5|nr:HEPN domain-containing protein [Dickeya chrysanthemi]WJM85162.1 HEPN domain-containing protein [Dickeya chrysanthemi]
MAISDVSQIISEMKFLVSNINSYVPAGTPSNNVFRSELSGLLIVSLAATYENCVKEVIIQHAESHHPAFGKYAEKQYDKLNSRVSLNDLYGYTGRLGNNLTEKFNKELLKAERRTSANNVPMNTNGQPSYNKFRIVKEYQRLLECRHAFAHARQKTTTIEDAFEMHRYGRFVILAFTRALS